MIYQAKMFDDSNFDDRMQILLQTMRAVLDTRFRAISTAIYSLLTFSTLLVAGCEREAPTAALPTSKGVQVVATVGMVGDLARQIGKDRVRVTDLMGEGIDPHMYKASPGDVRLMTDADILLYSGLHLEGRMEELIESLAKRPGSKHYGDQSYVVRVTERLGKESLRFPAEFEGHPDPHVWFDVKLWSSAAQRVSEALAAADTAGTDEFVSANAAYQAQLAALDAYVRTNILTIPAQARVMVTAHDAFGYFGRAYGVEVLAIQGISTDSEASLRDINSLVDTLVARKIPAVFIESSVPRKTIDALIEGCASRKHTIKIGGELYSDAFGAPGTFEGTYVGMVVHNVTTITNALGGKAAQWSYDGSVTAPQEHPASQGTAR